VSYKAQPLVAGAPLASALLVTGACVTDPGDQRYTLSAGWLSDPLESFV